MLSYSDVTYSHFVSQNQHELKHRLMISIHNDKKHKVNPIGYKFPTEGIDNISYYRDCSEIHTKNPTIGTIDFIDDIIFLDYKVTDDEFDNDNTYKFLLHFFNNNQESKLLHLVNFYKPIIPSKWWMKFCDFIRKNNFNDGVFLEIFNVFMWSEIIYDFEECIDSIFHLNLNKFIGVEYHHIYDNDRAKFISFKNPCDKNIGVVQSYNPKADR